MHIEIELFGKYKHNKVNLLSCVSSGTSIGILIGYGIFLVKKLFWFLIHYDYFQKYFRLVLSMWNNIFKYIIN